MYQVQISKGKGSYKVKAVTRGRVKAQRKYSRVTPEYNARIVNVATGEVLRRRKGA